MEDVLHLYNLAYDEKRPVVCFDESHIQLVGEVVERLPMHAGKPARSDYKYARGGTAALLVAMGPVTGRRLIETSKQ